jgi:hypothetical protein
MLGNYFFLGVNLSNFAIILDKFLYQKMEKNLDSWWWKSIPPREIKRFIT